MRFLFLKVKVLNIMNLETFFNTIYSESKKYRYVLHSIPEPCPNNMNYSCSAKISIVGEPKSEITVYIDNLNNQRYLLEKLHLLPTWGFTMLEPNV